MLAENDSAVMLDASKIAVPVGTVAVFQLALALKFAERGVGSQVVLRPRHAGGSAVTATNAVVASNLEPNMPPTCAGDIRVAGRGGKQSMRFGISISADLHQVSANHQFAGEALARG